MSISTIAAYRRFGSTLVVLAFLSVVGVAHSQTNNSWIAPSSGKWERAKYWDNGLPSIKQSAVIISNAASKVVTIDRHTARKFPNSLTISNLTVSAPYGVTNTLVLNRTGTAALHILNGLTVGINSFFPPNGEAELISTKSTLVVDGLLGGQLEDDGTMIIMGGSLITTNCSLQVATSYDNPSGLLIISNAVVQARDVTITLGNSSRGTMDVFAGTMTLSSFLAVGGGIQNSEGSLLVADGALLVVTNDETDIGGGDESSGTIAVSNATFLAADIFLGGTRGGGGGLVINNGTVTLRGGLVVGFGHAGGGDVSLNGGKLVATNNTTTIGADLADGSFNVSDGIFLGQTVLVTPGVNAGGTLSIQGGISILSSNLQIGGDESDATVSIAGGQLFVTNGLISADAFDYKNALIEISGGQLAVKTIEFGRQGFFLFGGILTVSGGSVTVSDGITLGDCTGGSVGYTMVDGGELTVINGTATGFIDIQNGQLTVDGGVVHVDKLVMTNNCSSLVHTGGTLIVGSVVLDPNAFGVTSVVREGNDLRVTWMMGPGQTNALQAASGSTHGHHTTNNFADIFVVTDNTTPGIVTNYLDVGAATNVPPRSYRVWLSP